LLAWFLVLTPWIALLIIVLRDAERNGEFDWNVLSTVIIAIATACGVIVAVRQWDALRSTDEKIGRQLSLIEADQRAWIGSHVTLSESDYLNYDEKGVHFFVTFSLKNYGKSPSVLTSTRVIISTEGWSPGATDKACKEAESPIATHQTVFPGASVDVQFPVEMPEIELARFRPGGDKSNSNVGLTMISCVAYKDTLSQRFHHTTAFYFMNAYQGTVMAGWLSRKMIKASEMFLFDVPLDRPPD
jgi:hypothetical protein